MFEKFNLPESLCFISVIGTIVFKMIMFRKLKMKTSTNNGREYIANKGGMKILSFDLGIFLSVIALVLVTTLKFNLGVVIIMQLAIWAFLIIVEKKI
ncbi:hypothetical protein [Clostridium cylindrosporum]|uniref:DUF3784 domain-containing protein n=1 Tax=Clostridium cylindrosporum DSM 605 TaxID=1121307 RepID=A0A0J8DGN2_CLOCY|nr:hypothetical protein [Clostridium cylindrosporum]KMT23384.1 hypothetical protein CLCY_8c01210 [Clostridium cylindrosporum DSM 605]